MMSRITMTSMLGLAVLAMGLTPVATRADDAKVKVTPAVIQSTDSTVSGATVQPVRWRAGFGGGGWGVGFGNRGGGVYFGNPGWGGYGGYYGGYRGYGYGGGYYPYYGGGYNYYYPNYGGYYYSPGYYYYNW